MTIFTNGSSPITQVRPGVQIVNVPPQILAPQPTASNVVGMVGTASWGPVGIGIPFSSPAQYATIFGPVKNRKFDMGMPVYNAWLQGASSFVGVRATDGTDTAATITAYAGSDASTHQGAVITAKWTGVLGNNITVTLSTGSKANTLNAKVSLPGIGTELYTNLSSASAATFWAAFCAAVNIGQGANTASNLIVATLGGSPTTTPTAGNSWTLSGGTDATDYSAITATTIVGSSVSRTGVYALSKVPVNFLVASDCDDTTTWTTLDAFAASSGVYNMVAGPAGETISSAVTAKQTAGIDSDWTKVIYGDWPTVFDQVNQVYRQCSPAAFAAGILAAVTPNNSSLNKQLNGIVTTQRSGNYQNGLTTYSDTEIGTLLTAGIDIISNPSPGGTYFSFQGGINSSSNAAANGDNWPMLTSLLGRTISSFAGIYVGKVNNAKLQLYVRTAISNALNNLVGQGLLDDGSFTIICDASNNTQAQTSVGILTASVNVRYQSIVRYFNVLLQGGQTVVITSTTPLTTQQLQATVG